VHNPVFLVSTGRTGTKFFSRLFSRHASGVAAYHTSQFTRLINVLGNFYALHQGTRFLVKGLWKFLKFGKICSSPKRYIECNPYYYGIVDIILEMFPHSKIICVVRSPKTFVISHLRWEKQRWQSIIANRCVPFWQPTSYGNQLMGFRWDIYQRVSFYSEVWARKNETITRSLPGDGRSVILRFEDVFDPKNGAQLLNDLMEWLDIRISKPITPETIGTKMNRSGGTPAQWWDERCSSIMRQFCSSLMREYGYDTHMDASTKRKKPFFVVGARR
jgi:hypothetical protein